MRHLGPVHWNLTAPLLYEHAVRRREGELGAGGSFVANTGIHTGRSPRDKYIVDEPATKDDGLAGATINQPVAPEQLRQPARSACSAYLQGRETVRPGPLMPAPTRNTACRCAWSATSAWHSLFARNMFIRPPAAELAGFPSRPSRSCTRPNSRPIPELDGINSETFILVNFAERLVLIGGTRYAGEIKKSVFGYLNFVLPARDVLPMHCSANVGPKRRQRDLLRPLRHRQDDAVGRRAAAR